MNNMLRLLVLVAAASLIATGISQGDLSRRGRYLTEEVAKCQECHTQRLASGELDRSAWLRGSTKSGMVSPDITPGGRLWKRWGENGMLRFLLTGRNPDGAVAASPMPAYQLRRDDAEAILTYLKTLHVK